MQNFRTTIYSPNDTASKAYWPTKSNKNAGELLQNRVDI
jgi:hypothetical protein